MVYDDEGHHALLIEFGRMNGGEGLGKFYHVTDINNGLSGEGP